MTIVTNRLSSVPPFARIMEKAGKKASAVGIRTMNAHQRTQAKKFSVELLEMQSLPAYDRLKLQGPVYISSMWMYLIRVRSRRFASRAGRHGRCGSNCSSACYLGKIVGADLVEYNPVQDVLERQQGAGKFEEFWVR